MLKVCPKTGGEKEGASAEGSSAVSSSVAHGEMGRSGNRASPGAWSEGNGVNVRGGVAPSEMGLPAIEAAKLYIVKVWGWKKASVGLGNPQWLDWGSLGKCRTTKDIELEICDIEREVITGLTALTGKEKEPPIVHA